MASCGNLPDVIPRSWIAGNVRTTLNTEFVHWSPEQGHWLEDTDAPGTYGKNVTGSASEGNWVMYAKVNPGTWINWHWHRNAQTLHVVSGTMVFEVNPQPRVKLGRAPTSSFPDTRCTTGLASAKSHARFSSEPPAERQTYDRRQRERVEGSLRDLLEGDP